MSFLEGVSVVFSLWCCSMLFSCVFWGRYGVLAWCLRMVFPYGVLSCCIVFSMFFLKLFLLNHVLL